MKHCMYCDALMANDAIFCPKCGRKQKKINNTINTNNENNYQLNPKLTTNQQILIESKVNNESKSIGVTYLLWCFFGWFGAHRFYLNDDEAMAMPIVWFLCWIIWYFMPIFGYVLLFTFLIWWVSDAFKIPNWINQNKKSIKIKAIQQINPQYISHKKNQLKHQQQEKIHEQEHQNHHVTQKEYHKPLKQDKISKRITFWVILVIIFVFFLIVGMNG